MNKNEKKIGIYIVTGVGLLLLLGLQFMLHRATPFMKDDFWYSTNLVTGKKVSSPLDILQSQIWHYFNWGGRVFNHAVLQAVLATGEFWADVLNILATILLGIVICVLGKTKNPLLFLGAEAMLVSFNASIHFSMYWEAGSANYLYSSSWVLFYAFVILRSLDDDAKKLKGISLWILPLALAAGWSNENMGPSCFLLTVFVILFLWLKKRKIDLFLVEGAVLTLVGSVALILAPGNFVRNQFNEDLPFLAMIKSRLMQFIFSSSNYLFPVFLLSLILLIAELTVFREELKIRNVALFAFACVAQGGMILSPTYPQRASFGIMCALIAYILAFLERRLKKGGPGRVFCLILIGSVYLHAITVVMTDLVFTPF